MARPVNTIDRLLKKVEKMPDGCWLWQGSIHPITGYAGVYVNWKSKLAHRAIYEMTKGSIPKDYQIDHLCSVRHCVNPDHLEAVTRRENVRRSRATKITLEQLDQVYELFNKGMKQIKIAELFGISPSHVSKLIKHNNLTKGL